jgi:hypothetical protein
MKQEPKETTNASENQTYLGFRIPDRLHLRLERIVYLRNQSSRLAGLGRFHKNKAAIEALEQWIEREEAKYRRPTSK